MPARWAALDFGIGELFNLIADAVVIGDATNGRIVLWNPAAEMILGYTADEAEGMSLEQLVPESLRDAHRRGIARYAATGHGPLVDDMTTVELPALHRDGSTVQTELRLSPLRRVPEEGTFVLAILRDVSARHRIQQELSDTAAQLEEANQALRDFVSMAAHDLKTPLTVITGALDLLADDQQLEPSQKTFVQMAARQSRHLDRLIESLLLLARLDAGALEPHPEAVQLAGAIAESLRSVPDLSATAQTPLSEIEVYADPDHLRRILVNYFSNAARYGQPPIIIDAEKTNENVLVAVRDHGTGVPDAFVNTLFDRFTRAAAYQTPGTGLGLSIVRALARSNGGDAWYESAEPGARFLLRLPAPI